MTWEPICDNCGKMIPSGMTYIDHNGLIFCNNECQGDYEEGD